MNEDAWLRNGIKAILKQIDAETVKLLIAAHKHSVSEKTYQPTTLLMPTSVAYQRYGLVTQLSDPSIGRVIPKNGSVPTDVRASDEQQEPWVHEFHIDGKRILVSEMIPYDKIIECGDQKLSIVCSRKQIFAIPVPEPKKLRVGAVINDEVGFCVIDASGYTVHDI